jgi:hypothetical protein
MRLFPIILIALIALCPIYAQDEGVFLPEKIMASLNKLNITIDGVDFKTNSIRIGKSSDSNLSELKMFIVNSEATVRNNGGLDIPDTNLFPTSFVVAVQNVPVEVSSDRVKEKMAKFLGGNLNPIGYSVVELNSLIARDKPLKIIIAVRTLKKSKTDDESPGNTAARLSAAITMLMVNEHSEQERQERLDNHK